MPHFQFTKMASVAVLSLISVPFISRIAIAQSINVDGVIKGRSGNSLIVQTSGNFDLVLQLTDTTEVGQVQGMFKARRKEMSMAALIPGLIVKVDGVYDDQHELIAKTVKFKGEDLQQAQAIQAGMHATQQRTQQNTEELEKQKAALEAQNAALKQHQAQIEANKQAIDAAVARFGQLDDYYIMDELTVYFDNGKVNVDPKYTPQLLALAQKAEAINGYMIEVKGYASASGNAALNQELSEDRADNVVNILVQQGRVPLTRMLAHGAMGETEQVGNATATESEAQNRRVVVHVLLNKAIAGI